MADDENDRPVLIGWRRDLSRPPRDFAPDAIYERLLNEVFSEPDGTRSHVITLHLYVEYWLDRLLTKLRLSVDQSFHSKIQRLKEHGALEEPLAANLHEINRLRNIYAHELDLTAAEARVHALLGQLQFDPYFQSTDPDTLRSVCIQVMFLLEATYHNDCKPPKLPGFPHGAIKARLEADGKLHWGECETLSRNVQGYIEEYLLRCPFCNIGTITRERDGTPGFKDAWMSRCDICGLTGDGYFLNLDTRAKHPR